MSKELKTITEPFDVVLTFDEITKLNEMVEQYKKGDYGFIKRKIDEVLNEN